MRRLPSYCYLSRLIFYILILITYLSGPPIEIWIKLMNHRSEFVDSLQTDRVGI